MNRLQTELLRLYLPRPEDAPEDAAQPRDLIDRDGRTRALIIEVGGPADWPPIERIWMGVQSDLGLPAPAIAVSGVDGLQLWISLAEPVPLGDARAFLEALRQRFLPDLPARRVRLFPCTEEADRHATLVPSPQSDPERWSAFVMPDLAALFTETPWLDIEPGVDGQADLLARLQSIGAQAFEAARSTLAATAPSGSSTPASTAGPSTSPGGDALEPRDFLLRVMRDRTVDLALRIEAAKALLR